MKIPRKYVATLVIMGILAIPIAVPALSPGDFSKRLDITFNGYLRATALTNFPALVVLGTNLTGFTYGDFSSPSGGDLRFTDGTGLVELPYEIDAWDTGGSSYVWVRVPLISGTGTTIRAYLGGTDTTSPAYTTNGAVWAENYADVMHFGDANVAGPYRDSSPYGNNATVTGDLDHRAGIIGGAKFLVDEEFVESNQDSPLTGALPRTLSMWINTPHTTGHICSLGSNDGALGAFGMAARSRNLHLWTGGSDGMASTYRLVRNTWRHIVATYDGTRYALYADGAEVLNGSVALNTQPYGMIVGSPAWQTYQGGYNFIADEFRCSTVARHPDWIWASWHSQSSNDQFARYGDVRNAVDTLPDIANAAAQQVTAFSATFSGALVSTGAAPTDVTLFWGESDAGRVIDGWDATNGFGQVTGTPPVLLSTNLTGLAAETTYSYRCYATNAYGETWGSPATSFTTLSLKPDILNLPATNVGMTMATIQGSITYTGGAPVEVTAFWGPNNGGSAPAAWSNAYYLGTNVAAAPVTVSADISGLDPEQQYYYRFYVTNAYGEAWAPSSGMFQTKDEVPMMLIPRGSDWRYLDDGSDQGSNWTQVTYDDGAWSNGIAKLGYGDGDVQTVVSYGGDDTNKYVTTYFRHALELSRGESAALSDTVISLLRDDGAVVYLNGTEIFRSNMPEGPIDYRTLAGSLTGDELTFHATNVPAGLFREGVNVIAVEVHQNTLRSTDLGFDLELEGRVFYPAVGFFPVPSVADFQLEASFPVLTTPTGNDHSGCALSERRRQVVIPNRDFTLGVATIQVYGMDGVHDRQILMPGWDDLEGVRVFDDASDLFFVLEEGTGDISLVTIGPDTMSIDKPTAGFWATGVDGSDNKGLEGVAYDHKRSCFYVVKEKYPLSVFRVSGTPTNTVTTPLFDGASVFAGLATDLSDVCFDAQLDRLLILSDESAIVFECTLDGTITATLPVDFPVEPWQPEGIALSADGTELHVVSEPARYYRYRRQGLGGRSLEGTNVSITVSLTSPWTNDVSVGYTINDGSAVFGSDMTNGGSAARGTLVIEAGATQGVIRVGIVDDSVPEEDEFFTVTLEGATNAVLAAGRDYIHTIEPVRKRLTVASQHGTPEPAPGIHDLPEGTILTCLVPNSPISQDGTQYACTGWTGGGSVPTSGASIATPPLTLTNDSSITWLWETNYWLATAIEGYGTLLTNSIGWYPSGTNVALTAVPGSYSSFSHWSGDIGGNDTNDPSIALFMDRARQVTVHFDAELATNSTPMWWLEIHYGPTNDFDALALSDSDGDGLAAWEEYWSGTIPTNILDALRITTVAPTSQGGGRLQWPSVADRLYTIYTATNVVAPQWTNVFTAPGSGADLAYTNPATLGDVRYYRLRVQLRE